MVPKKAMNILLVKINRTVIVLVTLLFLVGNLFLLYQVFVTDYIERDLNIQKSYDLNLTKFDDYTTIKRQRIINHQLINMVSAYDYSKLGDYLESVKLNPLAGDYWNIIAYSTLVVNQDVSQVNLYLHLSKIFSPLEVNVFRVRKFIERKIKNKEKAKT